jgi:hypothetical protein
MNPEQSQRWEDLLSEVGGAGGRGTPAGDCPADDLLLGLVQQRLPEGVSDRIRAHLADCETCREIAGLLADEDAIAEDRPLTSGAASWRLRLPVLVLAAAACLVVGLALARHLRDSTDLDTDTDTRLVAAARELASSVPDYFSAFDVLDGQERRAAYEGDVQRGALALQMPRFAILDVQPTFRWPAVAGASAYRVSLFDAQGGELWVRTVSTTELAYPADADALDWGTRYLWQVETEGAVGPVGGQAVFEVADAYTASHFRDACRRLWEKTDSDLAGVLEAHFAIRRGFFVHAWESLEGEDARRAVVAETRDYVARRLEIPVPLEGE